MYFRTQSGLWLGCKLLKLYKSILVFNIEHISWKNWEVGLWFCESFALIPIMYKIVIGLVNDIPIQHWYTFIINSTFNLNPCCAQPCSSKCQIGNLIKHVQKLLNIWHWSLIEIFSIGYFALTIANTFFVVKIYVLTLHF